MSNQLESAQEQYQAGQYKKAVATLWEVPLTDGGGLDEARELLKVASALRDATDGPLRADCEAQIQRAKEAIDRYESGLADDRVQQLEAGLKQDPAKLARWAKEAGLRWLQVETDTDAAAAVQTAAIAAAATGRDEPPQTCLIDAVEAEGWRLEHVQNVFRPTMLQTSPLRGAEFFMGGEVVEGQMRYFYLFRRVDEQGR
jgi:hypothetical protein